MLAGPGFRFHKAPVRQNPFGRGRHFRLLDHVRFRHGIRLIRRDNCDYVEQEKDREDPLVAVDHRSSFAGRIILQTFILKDFNLNVFSQILQQYSRFISL